MKKIIFVLILTVILTGCGKKNVTCTSSYDQEGISYSTKVIINYDGELVTETLSTLTMVFPTIDQATAMYDYYKNSEIYTASITGNKLILETVTEIGEEELFVKDLKNTYITDGYACK